MENEEDPVKRQQIVDARARNISHNVRFLECGSQSIEEFQADIAVLLRKGSPLSWGYKNNRETVLEDYARVVLKVYDASPTHFKEEDMPTRGV